MKILLSILAAASLFVGGLWSQYVTHKEQPQATFGTATVDFKFAQLQPYFLSGAGAVAGATSITLKSMKDIDGNALTMSAVFGTKGFGTLEPGNGTQEEQISFTNLVNNSNGTVTLTGVKSVTFVYPYTETSGLNKTHPGSATFVISNTSGFYNQLLSNMNDATITASFIFSSTTPPSYDATPATYSNLNFVDYQTLLATAFNGAGTSTYATMGISQLAPLATQGNGTASSTAGAPLVLTAAAATTTPGTLCLTWNCIVVASLGKISQSFLDLTAGWTFTSATSTNFGITGSVFGWNGQYLKFNGLAGAAGTVFTNDGSNNVSFATPKASTVSVSITEKTGTNTATTTIPNTTVVIPANTLSTTQYINFEITAYDQSATNNCAFGVDFGTGSATTSIAYFLTGTGSFGYSNGTIMATSTNREIYYSNGRDSDNTTLRYMNGFLTYTNTSPLYISVAEKVTTSATCALIGLSVQTLSN